MPKRSRKTNRDTFQVEELLPGKRWRPWRVASPEPAPTATVVTESSDPAPQPAPVPVVPEPSTSNSLPSSKVYPYSFENSNMKPDIIPIFDPEKSEIFSQQWLNKIEQLASIHNWSDNIKSYYMQSRLSGMAKLWHSSLTSYDLTWAQWKEELIRAFPCSIDYPEYLRDMLARKKSFNESMAQYFYQKNAMLTKLEITAEKAVACIIDGLPMHMKAPARAGNYKTSSELYSNFLAVMEESKFKPQSFRPRVSPVVRPRDPNEVQARDPKKTVTCFLCNETGHTVRRCPKNSNRPSCTHCGKIGHKSEDCWSRLVKPDTGANNSSTSINLISAEVNDTYYTEVNVNGIKLLGYLDSGAKINVARPEISHMLGIPLLPSTSLIRGFTGNVTHAKGFHRVQMTINDIPIETDLVIADFPLEKAQIIIGQPIINDPRLQIVIHGTNLSIQKAKQEIVEPVFNILAIEDIHVPEKRVPIHCSSDVVIPPHSTAPVRVIMPSADLSQDIFVEGRTRHCTVRNFQISSTLLNGQSGVLCISNDSSDALLLNQGELLARGDIDFEYPESCPSLQYDLNVSMEDVFAVDVQKIQCNSDNPTIKEKLNDLLIEYSGCFSSSTSDLGCTDKIEMKINLNSDNPVCYRPYRLSLPEKAIVRDKINDLLENNIIRESSSPYCSPIVLVKKKNGDYRLCVDYRKLNSITVKDKYPLPIIEEQIEKLCGKKYFTSLDMSQGFYQIPLEEQSIPKTGFITPEGHYEFLRMPFGLANSPSVYQRLMDRILGDLRFDKVLPYMDDLLIASTTEEEGLKTLKMVLDIIKESKLTLNLDKCKFLQTNIEYLGYEITNGGIRPGMKKTEAVSNFKEPQNVHELRMFLGLTSYFRKFVRGYALIASDLYKLLKKNQPWLWNSEQQNAFRKLKTILTTRPLLALYDHSAETEVHTDASSKGLAGILLQRHGNELRPVAYFSRKTSKEESVYHSYELETLAVVESLKRFRIYLAGIEFKVVTDCSAVRETFEKRDLLPRIARWWLSIQEYNFHVEHRPGTAHKHVDALSRVPLDTDSSTNITEIFVLDLLDWIVCTQNQDSKLRVIRDKLEIDKDDKELRNDYVIKDNRLYKKIANNQLRLAVPKSGRWYIMRKYHDDIGHPGLKRCETIIKEQFWFPKMTKFIRKYVNSCLDCAYKRGQYGKYEGRLHPIEKVDEPLHTIHIDHVGPFCKSRKGNSYLFVIVDSFTKFVWAEPCRTTKSAEVISNLEKIFSMFGYPKRIVSDRGTAFTSKTFRDYCNNKQIQHIQNSVASPRSNGQVERFNRTLIEAINKSTAEEKDWDTCIINVTWGINNTINSTTGFPAYRLMFKAKRSLLQGMGENEKDSEETAEAVQKEAKQNIEKTAERMKKTFDSKRKNPTIYKVNDLVLWNKSECATKDARKKLKEKFSGPYKIKKCLGNDRYVIVALKGVKGYKKFTAVVASDVLRKFMDVSEKEDSSSDSSIDSTEDLIDLLEG